MGPSPKWVPVGTVAIYRCPHVCVLYAKLYISSLLLLFQRSSGVGMTFSRYTHWASGYGCSLKRLICGLSGNTASV